MSSQNTTQYQSQVDATTYTYSPLKPSDREGRIRIVRGTITTTSAVTAAGNQTITLFKLPAKARLHSLVAIVPASVGTSSAKFGISQNDSTWASAVDLSTAGRKEVITTAAAAQYETLTETPVILTVVTTDFATAISAEFIGFYTID